MPLPKYKNPPPPPPPKRKSEGDSNVVVNVYGNVDLDTVTNVKKLCEDGKSITINIYSGGNEQKSS